ncbi:MAG: hypothetical protein GY937_24880 [bacterium]|nr:hypothetical protein [bacterium]
MNRFALAPIVAAGLLLLGAAPASSASLTTTYQLDHGQLYPSSPGNNFEVIGGTVTLRVNDSSPSTVGFHTWTSGTLLAISISAVETLGLGTPGTLFTSFGLSAPQPIGSLSASLSVLVGGTAYLAQGHVSGTIMSGGGAIQSLIFGANLDQLSVGTLSLISGGGSGGSGPLGSFSLSGVYGTEISRVLVPEPGTRTLLASALAMAALGSVVFARRRSR